MRAPNSYGSSALLMILGLIASGSAVLGVSACVSDAPTRTIEVTVPTGATFDFQIVPEPAEALLSLAALSTLTVLRRRRSSPVAD